MRMFRIFLAPALFLAVASQPACISDQRSAETSVQGEDDGEDCTFTQGFWKNHPEAWPVSELALGATLYTKAELLAILHLEVGGNGLVALAHQLIAAKLNVEAGAPDGDIEAAIEDADALIGDLVAPPVGDGFLHPSVTSELNDLLDQFNQFGPEDCEEEPEPEPEPEPECGDGEVDEGEECDDGNVEDGDGCSAECTIELPEGECGNGIVEPGEQCDDGNDDDHDSCSNDCRIITG